MKTVITVFAIIAFFNFAAFTVYTMLYVLFNLKAIEHLSQAESIHLIVASVLCLLFAKTSRWAAEISLNE